MKKTIKNVACAALCAALLFCMAVPAFALTDSDVYSYIDYGIGVRITCTSGINNLNGNAKIQLAFVANVNHFPEEDYECRATMTMNFYSGLPIISSSGYTDGMMASTSHEVPSGRIIESVDYKYDANRTEVYITTIE